MVEFDLLSHMTFAETPYFLSEGSSQATARQRARRANPSRRRNEHSTQGDSGVHGWTDKQTSKPLLQKIVERITPLRMCQGSALAPLI